MRWASGSILALVPHKIPEKFAELFRPTSHETITLFSTLVLWPCSASLSPTWNVAATTSIVRTSAKDGSAEVAFRCSVSIIWRTNATARIWYVIPTIALLDVFHDDERMYFRTNARSMGLYMACNVTEWSADVKVHLENIFSGEIFKKGFHPIGVGETGLDTSPYALTVFY